MIMTEEFKLGPCLVQGCDEKKTMFVCQGPDAGEDLSPDDLVSAWTCLEHSESVLDWLDKKARGCMS